MTKSGWREQQRKLPFEEKLRILEQLRLRDLEIRNSTFIPQPDSSMERPRGLKPSCTKRTF
jgi:hypothetical protein